MGWYDTVGMDELRLYRCERGEYARSGDGFSWLYNIFLTRYDI